MSFRTYTFEVDNPCNTRILDEDKKVIYTVNTEFSSNKTITYVRNAQEEIIAQSEWRDVLPDKVTLGNGKPMSLSDWLHKSPIPFKSTVSFKDDLGRKYRWENYTAGLQLQPFAEDTPGTEPIARFAKFDQDPKRRSEVHILMTERAMEIRDSVIISFLFLEKTRRTNEKSTVNRAASYGAEFGFVNIGMAGAS